MASPRAQAVEFEVPPPTGALFTPPINRQAFAISPDGRRLAFTAAGATGTNVWMRALDSTEVHAVPGTDGAISVSWAPDSRSIFFSTKQTLMQLNLETGSGRSLATRIAGPSQYNTTRDFQFDVSPDGQRFIMPTTGSVAPPAFTIVENWQDKFRRWERQAPRLNKKSLRG